MLYCGWENWAFPIQWNCKWESKRLQKQLCELNIQIDCLLFVSDWHDTDVYQHKQQLQRCYSLFCVVVWQTVEKLLDLLGTLDRWINETPPVDQPSRFGNKAYRTWYGKLEQVSTHTHTHIHKNSAHLQKKICELLYVCNWLRSFLYV